MLEIEKIISPSMDVNSYVVWQEGSKEAIVIDPSFEVEKILACLRAEQLRCRAILLTHGHFDHIIGVPEVKRAFHLPVYASDRCGKKSQRWLWRLCDCWPGRQRIGTKHLYICGLGSKSIAYAGAFAGTYVLLGGRARRFVRG